ncbi:MAG: integrase arm-type DNA-binding domain-containing protein [Terracidiphilus sp.]
MEIHKLKELQIKNAQKAKREYRLSDGGGLYLVVTPSGGKLWRWSYEFNGKEKLLSYGPYPYVSLDEARQLHAAARALKRSGVDPAADKQSKKREALESERVASMPTFAELTEEWLKTWSAKKSERYVGTVKTRLDRDILPKFGAIRIDQLKASEVAKIVKGIQDKRKASDLARRALQKTKQIMRFGVAIGYIDKSPITDILPGDLLEAHVIENFARIEPKNVPGLLQKIELYQGYPLTRLAMKLMALTFVRTESLICAEWKEIDFRANRWNIPKEHMKGKKVPHIVPLAHQTIEVLQLLQTLSGMSRYLFPGQGPKNPTMSDGTICKALEGMGYKGEMTGHGFRGIASTILHECGHAHEYIEAQLAHQRKDKVSGAYDYAKYLVPRTRMMQDWADFLEETLRSGEYKLIPPTYKIEVQSGVRDDRRVTNPRRKKAF